MGKVLLALACAAAAACASARPGPEVAAEPAREARPPQAVERASAILDAALSAKEVAARGDALAALGASGRGDALGKLTEALQAPEGELRFGAAKGLALLRDARAAPAIGEALSTEKGWSVRAELARAAGACRSSALLPVLEKALADPRPEVALAAAFALKDLGDPSGAAALAARGSPERRGLAKEGSDRWSRKVLAGQREGDPVLAAKTLAQLGTAEDVDLLVPRLGSPDAALRLWAAAAVLRLASAPPSP
jgi:HEAT repeat protein